MGKTKVVMNVWHEEPLADWEKELISGWLLEGGHPDVRRPYFISQVIERDK
jgi:hypothetical protein